MAQTFSIGPSTIPNGAVGTPYNQNIRANDGDGDDNDLNNAEAEDNFTYAVTAGALPPGLTLGAGPTAAGVPLSGTPTTAGSYSFTVTATDLAGDPPFSITYSSVIIFLQVTPSSLPNGTQGVAYNQTVSANGGAGPYTFSILSGALPTGLAFNPATGVINGTPTAGGAYSFTIQARDTLGNTGSQAYSVNIGTASLTVSPASLPNGMQGSSYSQTVTASGGTGSYTFAVVSGALPTGLSLNPSTGLINGTPTAGNNSYNFTIQATDGSGNVGSRAYTVNIGVASLLTVSPTSLPNGTQNVAYPSQTVSASGGTGPYTYAVITGSLPTGLSLNANSGIISGTPTTSGTYNFTIQATDSLGSTGGQAYSVNIGTASLSISPASLPNGTQNVPYPSQTMSASGGAGPYTFSVSAGALPAGLSLSSGGVISGTPTGSGSSTFTIQVADSQGNTGGRAYTVNIGTATLTVNPPTLPAATQGVAYNQTIIASGGTGPYSYVVSAGSLPAGLTLNSVTGVISGTPTGSGPSSFSIRATDTQGNIGTRAYSVNVGTNSLTINPATLPSTVVGRPYSVTVVASGGTGPYTYSVTSGALPAGLTLNASTGVISGTPSAQGVYAFTIQGRDVNGNIGSRAYSLTNRSDPALDPEVIGLVNAQVAAARRFASAQIDNISQHLAGLHDHFDPCSFNFGVNLPAPPDNNKNSPYSPAPGVAARSYEPPPNSPAGQIANRMPNPQGCDKNGWGPSLAVWTSGTVQFGSTTPNGLATSNGFTTAGLTVGVDWKANDAFIIGAALGYGADRTTIGSNSTRSDSSSINAMLYTSYNPLGSWFIDTALGYGWLSYDNHRWVTDDGSTATGNRKGSFWFGSVSTGYDVKHGALRLTPYVRADLISAQLDAYTEQGASAELLTYGSMKFRTVAGALGLRGAYDIPASWGVLTPIARAEYRHAMDGSFDQFMYYTDLGTGVSSTLSQGSTSRGAATGGLGFRARSFSGLTAQFEYAITSGGSQHSQSLRAAMALPF